MTSGSGVAMAFAAFLAPLSAAPCSSSIAEICLAPYVSPSAWACGARAARTLATVFAVASAPPSL